jgi:choline-sulfatase
MITWIDRQVGLVLQALHTAGLADDTLVVATADHGDMLGERGYWYKMCFFERAVRVPLVLSWPQRIAPRRVGPTVSHVDLTATLLDVAGARPVGPVDGRSLLPLAAGNGAGWLDTACAEYTAEGTTQPLFMIRRERWKFICGEGDPLQLYDLERDPLELSNLAGRPEHAGTESAFALEARRRWDSAAIRSAVLRSQRERLLVQKALLAGRRHPWDYAPPADADRRYYRNYPDAADIERPSRLPARPAPRRDGPGGDASA